MTISERISNVQLQSIANATRWLFWTLLVYVLWWMLIDALSPDSPMHPQARASLWGKFRWYFPSKFTLIVQAVPLFFLYFMQSSLNKGVVLSDESRIKQGLDYLTSLIWSLSYLLFLKFLFDYFVQPNWWSWEF